MQLELVIAVFPMTLVLQFWHLIAKRQAFPCVFFEDSIPNTSNEVEINFIIVFLVEVNQKSVLAVVYGVTFPVLTVVTRRTVCCCHPLWPRVAGRNYLLLPVTYFDCARDVTNTSRYQLGAAQVP